MNENNQNMNKRDFPDLDSKEKILEYSSNFNVPYSLTKEEALQKLNEKIESGVKTGNIKPLLKSRFIYLVSYAAAAIIAFIGIWYFLFYNTRFELKASRGQQNEYNLPDGSLVSMDAESKISFRKKDFIKKRKVSFEGEAFFNIKKGNKFSINTPNAEIQILGTSFNVFARDSIFKVSCFTGKIKVVSGDKTVFIIPGESAAIVEKRLRKFAEKDINTVTNWRNGEFYFENTSLSLIFREIERQFNVTFVVPNIEKKFFTGSFTNKNLIDALDITCIPMGLTYEIGSNSKILIREKLH